MEDVSISKFRAQVVRAGSTPASPGFVVSEGQNPVDPSGSGQNHLPVTIATASTGLSITESQVLGGAGTVGQYIRGDGSLADFPATMGGGSSVSYYLNGSVSQGTIGGVAYREVNRTPIFGAGTDIMTSSNGYIANFITDAGDPNKLLIPAGNWNLETYFSASSGGGSPNFYVELYKYNGTTFTLIATSSATPELIAFGTNINPYFTTLAVPETVLALTDRLALRYYVNTSGRTITLHTENGHLCQVITTFTTGLTALNGLTNQVQYLTVGTSGTDFAISSASDTHTFNLPTASATNRGALSSADWSTFNGKQNALTNPVTGTGTTNYLPKFTGASAIGNSLIFDNGTNVGINTNSPSAWNGNQGFIVSQYAATGNSIYSLQSNTTVVDTGAVYEGFSNAVTVGSKALGSIAFLRENTSTTALNSYTGFYTNNAGVVSEKIRITSDGSLGIGNILPGKKLHISASGEGLLRLERTGASARQWDINIKPNFVIGDNNAGQDRFFIDTLGNVGIGATPDASYKLDVNGTGRFSGRLLVSHATSGNYGAVIYNTSATGEGLTVRGGSTSSHSSFIVQPYDGSVSLLNILATGAATFDTTAGTSAIFNSTNASGGFIAFRRSGTNIGYLGNSAQLGIGTLNAFELRADNNLFLTTTSGSLSMLSTGNLGINQTNPTARLEVVPENANGNEGIFVNQLGSRQSTIRFKSAHSSSSDYRVGASITVGSAFEIYSIAAAASRLVIDSTGASIFSNVVVSPIFSGENSTSASPNLQSWNKATSGDNKFVEFYTEGGGGTLRGSIDYNRVAGLIRYNTISDANLKNIIGDSDKIKSIQILNSTRIKEYSWKDDESNKTQIGVIAQELNETYKGAVSEGSELELLGTENYKPWAVDKTAFTFHLIAGWQEHERIIKELRQEIDTLKN